MITGAHVVISSKDAEADREFCRDVLGLPHVDAGHGWLIFGLPPAEVAMHPADTGDRHELFLMSDDIEATIVSLAAKGVSCTPVEELPWGRLTRFTLPGGGTLAIYEPKHERPLQPG